VWNHRSAFGLLGFILVWAAFFWIIGIVSAHLAPGVHPPPPPVAIGHGIRESFVFLGDVIKNIFH
jgi:hypothetical protein